MVQTTSQAMTETITAGQRHGYSDGKEKNVGVEQDSADRRKGDREADHRQLQGRGGEVKAVLRWP